MKRNLRPWQTVESVRREERERKTAVMAHQTAVMTELLTPPISEALAVEDPNVFNMAEYKALVADLGVDDSAVKNYELRQFFATEGIQVYDYQKVVAFMDAKTVDEGKKHRIQNLIWAWKPISDKYPDVGKTPSAVGLTNAALSFDVSSFRLSNIFGRGLSFDAPLISSGRTTRAYARAIPHAVLLTVKKLRDKFGDAVHFYASDYDVQYPDPFLMVTGPGLDYYVIERWDEPTFRS